MCSLANLHLLICSYKPNHINSLPPVFEYSNIYKIQIQFLTCCPPLSSTEVGMMMVLLVMMITMLVVVMIMMMLLEITLNIAYLGIAYWYSIHLIIMMVKRI